MKFLQESYQMFVMLGICPSDKPISRWQKMFYKFIPVFCLIILFIGQILSSAYCVKYISIDLSRAICAVYQIVSTTACIYIIIMVYVKRDDIKKMFDYFQTFYDPNEHKDKSKYLNKADQQSKLVSKYMYKYFLIICSMSVLIIATGSVFYQIWKYGHIDPSNLYRNFRFVLPWNQNTLLGWMAETFISFLLTVCCFLSAPAVATLFISVCIFHSAFYKMYQHQIDNIIAAANVRHNSTDRMLEFIKESILFHVSVKELFIHTANVFSSFLLVQIIGTMVVLTSCIFVLDLAIHNFSIEVCFVLFASVFTTSVLYLYCFFGQRSTDSYLAFADCLCECDWTSLPVQQQKYFVLMIAHAQKPLYYDGWGLVNLDMELFLKIFKTVISYYMIFKTLTNV